MAQIGPMLQRVRELVEELGPTVYLDLPQPPLPVRVTADAQGTGLRVGVFVTEVEPGMLAEFLPILTRSGAFDATTVTRRTAVGTVDPQNLGQFSEIPDSIQVEAAAAVYRELDHSVPEAWNPASNWSRSGPRPTGQGVIVGIVDSGIDVTHPSLRTPSGQTRILRLWDQEPRGSKLSPLPYRYGSEWDGAAVNSYLAAGQPFPSTDDRGHGTAVAGIVAGNAMAAPQRRYVGVAEHADLVVVKLDASAYQFTDSRFVAQGIEYVFKYAEGQGRPAVVNLSQGARIGPHDPNGQFEMSIQDVLEDNEHRILVKSAGNDAAADAHASLDLDQGESKNIWVDVPAGVGPSVLVDIWYDVADRIAIEVIDPLNISTRPVLGNTRATRTLAGGKCTITGWPNRHTGASQIAVFIEDSANAHDVMPGMWIIRFIGAEMDSGQPVHAWLERGRPNSPRFLAPDSNCTTTPPAAVTSAICVGSYTMGPTHSLEASSSRGPDRLGKPPALLAAPGSPITSCDTSQGPTTTTGPYRSVSGTSFAAPHVTGAIALMLQVNPKLTRDQAISCLQRTCRNDGDTNAGPAEGWGSGKLDIGAALHCVLHQAQDGSQP